MNILKAYHENGFHLARGLLDDINFVAIEGWLLQKINDYLSVCEINSSEWVKYAKDNPEIVTKIYDEMRDNEHLLELGKCPKITQIVRQLIDKPMLYRKIPLRIDVPFEIKELAYWHQDDFYVKGNKYELTVWVPLFDTNMEQGCLSVMPRSHRLGKIPHNLRVGKKDMPTGIYDREVRLIEMKRGDALFISSYLIHSSNLNISNQIRYSVQLRYTTGALEPSTEMNGVLYV